MLYSKWPMISADWLVWHERMRAWCGNKFSLHVSNDNFLSKNLYANSTWTWIPTWYRSTTLYVCGVKTARNRTENEQRALTAFLFQRRNWERNQNKNYYLDVKCFCSNQVKKLWGSRYVRLLTNLLSNKQRGFLVEGEAFKRKVQALCWRRFACKVFEKTEKQDKINICLRFWSNPSLNSSISLLACCQNLWTSAPVALFSLPPPSTTPSWEMTHRHHPG